MRGHCGTFVERSLYHRRGARLDQIPHIDELVDRFCVSSPWQQYHLSRFDVRAPGRLLVEWEGTIRQNIPAGGDHGPPERFHGHSFHTLRDGRFTDR